MAEPLSDTFVELNGELMFVDPGDQRGRALLAAGGALHPDAARLWECAVRMTAWNWVVDLGANYGEVLLAVDLPEHASLAAVEPSPRVLPYLRRTLARALPEARILPVAISDRDGAEVMYENLTWSGNSTLAADWTPDRDHDWHEITVPTCSLASLLGELGVRPEHSVLVKMDIEGYEVRVLRESLEALRALSRCVLMLEVVRFGLDDLDWLTSAFDVSCLDTGTGRLVDCSELTGRRLSALLGSSAVHRRDVIAVPRVIGPASR